MVLKSRLQKRSLFYTNDPFYNLKECCKKIPFVKAVYIDGKTCVRIIVVVNDDTDDITVRSILFEISNLASKDIEVITKRITAIEDIPENFKKLI